ncbi:DUF3577 domain-containing protein [Testudinibacter sp. P80/BLE/0925]|uniref:DUF3577 domain-containing protein n=1 Tax=Testudinibacter sp. TW-1 TaxID=3417757 RepID=UPI003D35E87F
MTTQTSNDKDTIYFNLHLNGLAYINRIREVKPKKGDSFYACSLAFLRGDSDNTEYTYVDVRVSGEKAKSLIQRSEQACKEEKKILASVTVGDIYPDTFVYEKGSRKGETGVMLKGRLLRIKSLKIDGVLKYSEAAQSNAQTNTEQSEANA